MPRGHLGCEGRCASPPPGSGTHPPTDCAQAHPRRLVALAPAPQGLPSRQGSPQAPPPLVAPRQAPCWLEVRGPPCSCHTPRVHPGPPPPPGAARPASPGSSRLWASAPLCWCLSPAGTTGTPALGHAVTMSHSLLSGTQDRQAAPCGGTGWGAPALEPQSSWGAPGAGRPARPRARPQCGCGGRKLLWDWIFSKEPFCSNL